MQSDSGKRIAGNSKQLQLVFDIWQRARPSAEQMVQWERQLTALTEVIDNNASDETVISITDEHAKLLSDLGQELATQAVEFEQQKLLLESIQRETSGLKPGKSTEQLLRVLSRLKSDAFPRVVEWQRKRDQIDVALTWIEGISLADYLQNIREGRRPPVDPGQALRLMNGLANSVCHLHRRLQVAHGDLQPANVLVTSHSSRLQVIDFGSSWTTDWTSRRNDGDGHHRCYAAPELQNAKTPVSLACDQFSVCVLFFELLTLQLPYGGLGGKAGRPEFIARAADTLIPPSQISKTCQKLPRSLRDRLDALVVRGLAINPDERYPDHNTWLNDWQDLSARFRITPDLPPIENALTKVIGWFVKPHDKD